MGEGKTARFGTSWLWLAALVAYTGVGAVLLLWPNGWTLNRINVDVYVFLRGNGGPLWATPEDVAVALNCLIFIPAGAFLSLALPRLRWWHVAAAGFGLSLSVEVAQWALLPGRSPEVIDLVANTLGAALGAVIVAGVRGWSLRRSRSSSDRHQSRQHK
ncbi:VanZ family protein [Ornithinimicrobium sp. Arc0846-15]|nr:VanZ family protein [Ornithinimicrobium laminariae]